jgi:hypothetical protein
MNRSPGSKLMTYSLDSCYLKHAHRDLQIILHPGMEHI